MFKRKTSKEKVKRIFSNHHNYGQVKKTISSFIEKKFVGGKKNGKPSGSLIQPTQIQEVTWP
jgi:hypothetical protein